MASFLTELKRRNVLRVAAAYAVIAWIIIEAGSVLLPTFGASEFAFQVYVVAVIVGFLVSLVIAWVFEVTPEGVKLEKNIDRSESVTTRTGRRLDYSIIGLLIVALGVSVTLNVTGMRPSQKTTAPATDRLSIAVLPFKTNSIGPDAELFADGIHDDLLTRLANISALKVISRTSVMEYRDTTKKISQIAEELGVETVLEGGVQQIGGNVRINAQLIDARTDEHLWAKTYDRTFSMQNIFAIQSDISQEIAGALRATLTTEENSRLAHAPTANMDAYHLYTQGRANLYERRLESLLEAREQFFQATELDPDYAEAFAGLADSILLLYNNHAAVSREEMLTEAASAIGKALLLDPELADAYASLGLLKHQMWQETRTGPHLRGSESAFRRALVLSPNHARAYMWFATVRTDEEKYDEAIDLYHDSLRVDPLGRVPYANLPGLYALMGRNEEALDLYVKAVRLHPEWPTAYLSLSAQLQGLGRLDESVAWAMRGQELSTDPLAGASLIGPYIEFGDFDAVRSSLADFPTDHQLYELVGGLDKVLDGDFAAAAAEFERIVESSENPRAFLFDVVAVTALVAGDYETARTFTERGHPAFVADTEVQVDRFNVADVVRYAGILLAQGENERAEYLLATALPVAQRLPRVGIAGQGIRDVQILAMQGKTIEALSAFREAIDEGYRGSMFSDGLPLALDPYLESIRSQPEFQAMTSEIDSAVRRMRDNVMQAQASSNWDDLLSLADSS